MSQNRPSDVEYWRAGALDAVTAALSQQFAIGKLSQVGYDAEREGASEARLTHNDGALRGFLAKYVPGDTHLTNYPD